jgi:hypothetical protein
MAVIRTWLKSSGSPEYRTYQCFACVETMTIGLEHSASPGLRWRDFPARPPPAGRGIPDDVGWIARMVKRITGKEVSASWR